MQSEIPEVRLLAAVIAVSLRDLTHPPVKVLKGRRPRLETLSAAQFLFTGTCDGYLAAMDIDPWHFRQKIFRMMSDTQTDKIAGFDQMQRRNMKWNYYFWKENYERLGGTVFDDEEEFTDYAQLDS
jgi:hypothetical protein